jgi:WD40 repeat protein
MTRRHLIIDRPPMAGKNMSTHIQISVDDRAAIEPWVTTLAAHLEYPLVDQFGSPIAYRLLSVSGETLLPATGRFADARFPSGSQFVLEPDWPRTASMPQYAREAEQQTHVSILARRIDRRSLMSAGILTTFSLLGLGSGMTTAFAQRLLNQRKMAASPVSLCTTFRHHQQTVRTVTWAPDESMVASGGNDGIAFLWKLDGTVLHMLPFSAPVRALALSPDGAQLAAGSANCVSFFDAQTGSQLAENAGQHTAAVTSLGWTNEGSAPLALSAGIDRRAIVWNEQSHQPQVVFRQHTSAIEALAVLANTVATASFGGVARIWSATSGQELHGYYADSQHAFRAIAFSSLGTLAAGSDDGVVRLWSDGRICTRQIPDTFGLHCVDGALHLQGHTRPVQAIAFSPDGTLLATGGDDKKLIIWSVPKKTPVLIQDQPDVLTALAWSPSGRYLAGAMGSRVAIWQVHLEEKRK